MTATILQIPDTPLAANAPANVPSAHVDLDPARPWLQARAITMLSLAVRVLPVDSDHQTIRLDVEVSDDLLTWATQETIEATFGLDGAISVSVRIPTERYLRLAAPEMAFFAKWKPYPGTATLDAAGLQITDTTTTLELNHANSAWLVSFLDTL